MSSKKLLCRTHCVYLFYDQSYWHLCTYDMPVCQKDHKNMFLNLPVTKWLGFYFHLFLRKKKDNLINERKCLRKKNYSENKFKNVLKIKLWDNVRLPQSYILHTRNFPNEQYYFFFQTPQNVTIHTFSPEQIFFKIN